MRTRQDDDTRPDLITIIERLDRLDRWDMEHSAHSSAQELFRETKKRRRPTWATTRCRLNTPNGE